MKTTTKQKLPSARHSTPKGYRRLRLGEVIQPEDLANDLDNIDIPGSKSCICPELPAGFIKTICAGFKVKITDSCAYYRKLKSS